MTTRIIPEKRELVCDVCDAVTQEGFGANSRRRRGQLVLKQDMFCFMGDRQGTEAKVYDLCDDCLSQAETLIKNMKEARNGSVSTNQ